MTNSRWRLTVFALLAALCLTGAAAAVPSDPVPHGPGVDPAAPSAGAAEAVANVLPRPFATGDIFAATPAGSLNWYGPDGTFVAALSTGLASIQAVAADPFGRLWAIDRARPATLARIDEAGAVTTVSPVGATITPWSLAFDALGNVYVGDWEIGGKVSKFSSGGQYLGVAINSESDYIDLAPDQCTMYLQRPGWNMSATERWNACTGAFINTFHDPFSDTETAHGVRLLPDGSVLMKNPAVMRIDTTGQLVSAYSFAECTLGAPESLSPDGSSFYVGCSGQGVYEVDVATGARIRALPIAIPLTVMGGFRAAAGGTPQPDATPPTITINTPVDGATYQLGQPVNADYACDDQGGSGLASCAGPVADGAPLDTSSVGQKMFVVDARDGAGNSASATARYEVVQPTLAIADATVTEGAAAALVVTLSNAGTYPVTVRYATANGSARQGGDYARTTGTLTFGPGETSKTISVATIGDALYELDETALVNLTLPTNAVLVDAQGVATIANDDPMPSVTLGDAAVLEGAAGTTSQLVFTVNLSAPSGVQSRMRLGTANGTAVAPSDYVARNGFLTIRAGGTTGTFVVTVKGDALVEPDEILALLMSAPVNVTIADGEGAGTILNDD